EPPPPLWPALSHRGADAPGHRWGSEASRGGDRRVFGAPHPGPTTPPSPPPPFCPTFPGGPGWWRAVGAASPHLLLACPGPLAALPAPLPRRPYTDLRRGSLPLGGSLSGTRRAYTLAALPLHAARPGVGRLRQRASPGPSARPAVPGPLYASR